MTKEKLAYTLPELVEATGMSMSSIRIEIDKGRLTPRYPNRKPIVPRAEAERWIDSMPSEPRRAS